MAGTTGRRQTKQPCSNQNGQKETDGQQSGGMDDVFFQGVHVVSNFQLTMSHYLNSNWLAGQAKSTLALG